MSRLLPIRVQTHSAAPASEAAHTHVHAPDLSEPIPGPAPVLVWVGDCPIDEAEIAREMQHHRSADPQQARTEAARALVVRTLLRREIERLGLAGTLQAQSEESREEAEIELLIEREVAVPSPDPDACQRWYDQNSEHLHQPDRMRVRHILLAAAPGDIRARLAARDLGENLIAQLRSHPERFTEFAQRHSACPSKDDGGDLGWIERGDTTPEFERQLLMLNPGLAGLTVETRYGHHVVCIDEIVRGAALSFEHAAPRIAAYLETQARQNAISQYLHILAQRHGVRGLEASSAHSAL